MNTNNKPIGVFDSGVGGISVLGELYKLMPNENYIYFGDSKNAPYGTKTEEEILKHTQNSIETLINMGVKAVVIACNTATSVAAKKLRESYDIPIIGIEPAVKPAALNHKNSKIIVMATPMTLKKEKFARLMECYSDISEIIPIPCPKLVEIIEKGITDGKEIDTYLENLFGEYKKDDISAVVLGCTHYPFIKDSIDKFFNFKADIIDGGYGTAKETQRRLLCENFVCDNKEKGNIEFISSKKNKAETDLMKKMFKIIINK